MSEAEKYIFYIDDEHAGQRMDGVLSLLLEEASRNYIQKLIAAGNVSVDGSVITSKKEKLKAGQCVELMVPPAEPCQAQPEDIPLDIVYEDEDVIVVNKPKGMVVHPAAGNLSGTLVNGLLFHCGALSNINGVERPGIVHRIDKDTSGLLMAAKTDLAHRSLSEQLAIHSVTRMYRAVVYFNLKDEAGTIDAPIGRDPKNRLRMAVVPDGKHAVTHYRLVEQFNGFSMITARLETGRTHQIRVHLSAIGCPVYGDFLYGTERPDTLPGRFALHSHFVRFTHPMTGEVLEFTSELPAELLRLISVQTEGGGT